MQKHPNQTPFRDASLKKGFRIHKGKSWGNRMAQKSYWGSILVIIWVSCECTERRFKLRARVYREGSQRYKGVSILSVSMVILQGFLFQNLTAFSPNTFVPQHLSYRESDQATNNSAKETDEETGNKDELCRKRNPLAALWLIKTFARYAFSCVCSSNSTYPITYTAFRLPCNSRPTPAISSIRIPRTASHLNYSGCIGGV
jgi:hypothetical protein